MGFAPFHPLYIKKSANASQGEKRLFGKSRSDIIKADKSTDYTLSEGVDGKSYEFELRT
jgi:hypothetical protein